MKTLKIQSTDTEQLDSLINQALSLEWHLSIIAKCPSMRTIQRKGSGLTAWHKSFKQPVIHYSALALHKPVILPILAEPHKQTGLADINIIDQQHLVSWDTIDITDVFSWYAMITLTVQGMRIMKHIDWLTPSDLSNCFNVKTKNVFSVKIIPT